MATHAPGAKPDGKAFWVRIDRSTMGKGGQNVAVRSVSPLSSPRRHNRKSLDDVASHEGAVTFKNGKSFSPESMRMSVDEFEKLVASFGKVDVSGDGFISAAEVGRLFDECGLDVPPREVEFLVLSIDPDGSGSIDFGEFSGIINSMDEQKGRGAEESEGADGGKKPMGVNMRKFLNALADQRDEFVAQGKLKEAGGADRNLLVAKKLDDENFLGRRLEEVSSQLFSISQSKKETVLSAKKQYKAAVKEQQARIAEQMSNLKAKHADALAALEADMESKMPQKAYPSSSLQHEMRKFDALVGQKMYNEAALVQKRVDDLYAKEMAECQAKYRLRMKKKIAALAAEQDREMRGFKMRVDWSLTNGDRKQNILLNTTRQRFTNKKDSFNSSFGQELAMFETLKENHGKHLTRRPSTPGKLEPNGKLELFREKSFDGYYV